MILFLFFINSCSFYSLSLKQKGLEKDFIQKAIVNNYQFLDEVTEEDLDKLVNEEYKDKYWDGPHTITLLNVIARWDDPKSVHKFFNAVTKACDQDLKKMRQIAMKCMEKAFLYKSVNFIKESFKFVDGKDISEEEASSLLNLCLNTEDERKIKLHKGYQRLEEDIYKSIDILLAKISLNNYISRILTDKIIKKIICLDYLDLDTGFGTLDLVVNYKEAEELNKNWLENGRLANLMLEKSLSTTAVNLIEIAERFKELPENKVKIYEPFSYKNFVQFLKEMDMEWDEEIEFLGKLNRASALKQNNEGLLKVEVAIRKRYSKAIVALLSIKGCEYPRRVYKSIIESNDVALFNLIPLHSLDYRLLVEIKESQNRELEIAFMNRIKETELEKLLIEGRDKGLKEWIINNYENDNSPQRKINATEMVCIYGDKEVVDAIAEKKDINEHLLLTASKLGRGKLVEYLLEKYPYWDIESKPEGEYNALMLASLYGYKEVCELLIEKGASVHTEDGNGNTALTLAAKEGHREVCKLLLDKGAKVDAANKDRRTALALAAEKGHTDICKLLLEKEADIDIPDKDKKTALALAAEKGHKEVCKLMLDRGANIDIPDKGGRTALALAADKGHKEVCELLIEKGANFDVIANNNYTPLVAATVRRHGQICDLLLQVGANINVLVNEEWPLLTIAAFTGQVRVCELLLNKGADVDTIDIKGLTALMYAAKKGHKQVCELLIGKGADINTKDSEGCTALMYATISGYKQICELLLIKGAKVDEINNDGWSALTFAAKEGHTDICNFLVTVGAKIDLDGLIPPIVVAVAAGHAGICRILIEDESKIYSLLYEDITLLMIAAAMGQVQVCNLLLERGADINFQNNRGYTALMFAAAMNKVEICKLLLEKGDDVDCQDNKGNTALMYAAEMNKVEVCNLLLTRRINVNAKNNQKRSALMLAAQKGHKKVCELLLKNGADINAIENNGATALTFAACMGNKEVCEFLLEKGADINYSNSFSPLIAAIASSHIDICEFLIDRAANVNVALEGTGWTPLMVSSAKGQVEICQLLLKKGAKLDKKDHKGYTALMHAAENGQKMTCEMILKEDKLSVADIKDALISAESNNHENIVKLLSDTISKMDDQNSEEEEEKNIPKEASNGGVSNIISINDKFEQDQGIEIPNMPILESASNPSSTPAESDELANLTHKIPST